jgi:alpha(1,3/1,4) fucosyltransferase
MNIICLEGMASTKQNIAITGRFQNSYYSGSIPQVAIALARTLSIAGHNVTLLRPEGDPDWFMDTHEYKDKVPRRQLLREQTEPFDIIIEVAWSLAAAEREHYGKKVFMFLHYPPIFHEIESSVYKWNPTVRDFKNIHAIITYDFYSKQDTHYLEFISNKPVIQIPYIWDNEPLDTYVKETHVPDWSVAAKAAESSLPDSVPKTMAWCARIVESNFSNSSSCVIPLNIVSVIRSRGCAIRFGVHNATNTAQSAFFQTNVSKNLLLPDISGCMIPRVRLPDLCREKTVIIAHQRFRPMKSFLLDALYLGIPMIHNCALLKQFGAPYMYELNQIQHAADLWTQMMSDYDSQKGFFSTKAADIRKAALRARFSPSAVAQVCSQQICGQLPTLAAIVPKRTNELRIAFANMWDDFQPNHNFFMYLLSWVGRLNNIRVVHDDTNPNLVFFGPLSRGAEAKYPGVPKVFFTGENAPKNKDKDTFLNLGFAYDILYDNYVRLPLWVLEINWWGADPNKVKNPRYVSLDDALRVPDSVLDSKSKFCAFVATNPTNQNRNTAFQILNNWRRVDSGGRLFCNLPSGPIPAGLGGGGGELAKIEFYKQYKFALTYENSSGPGYCTEKLFHAKVAGCVPIYWGDPFVDRDFDSSGYINANQVSTPEQLIELVKAVADDPVKWRTMAAVPALSEFKKIWCERTMEHVAKLIFKAILRKDITPIQDTDWSAARTFATTVYETPFAPAAPAPAPVAPAAPIVVQNIVHTPPSPAPIVVQNTVHTPPSPAPAEAATGKRLLLTAANAKYVESAINAVASFRKYDTQTPIHVYVWPDVKDEFTALFQKVGGTNIEIRKLPVTIERETPWPDFWDPQHFAWKLWILNHTLNTTDKDTNILYIDSGTVFVQSPAKIWNQIEANGIFLLNDPTQTNERWCHPRFCSELKVTSAELSANQLWAGCLGYRIGHESNTIFRYALQLTNDNRDLIVGNKWQSYSVVCKGHRHDQSILSILTQRKACPRFPLHEFYCDISYKAAQNAGVPLYVHRGQFKAIIPFAETIDEAYVINLQRRNDRLDSFKEAHPYMKDKTYVWSATDGQHLKLTPDIVHCFRNNDFKWKKAVMGCALSHLGLWEKLANDPIAKTYLIMEDDVRFSPEWVLWWQEYGKNIPAEADVVYLGGVLPPNKPALPYIIDPVNPYFARVKSNTLYGGSTPRRYFHFCNYAYILTQRGAQKLVTLVKEKGIFTSGDHMIVNHGDEYLNICFTTPLLATCFQENDPIYQKSDFNNFARVDNFDSDLWNNVECFSPDEINMCLTTDLQAKTQVAAPPQPQKSAQHQLPEEQITLWNNLLKAIALKQAEPIGDYLKQIFDIWQGYTIQEFNQRLSYFRVLEQLIVMDEPMLKPHTSYMLERIKGFTQKSYDVLFSKMRDVLEDSKKPTTNGITYFDRPGEKRIQVFHTDIDPQTLMEREWLDTLFPYPLDYKQFSNIQDLVNTQSPFFIYQKTPARDMNKVVIVVLDMLRTVGKQLTVLHLSDEYGNDDITWYNHPSIKAVIRNYWRPELKSFGEKVIIIPLGYTNGRSGRALSTTAPAFNDRPHIWSFVGSLDRPGRPEAISLLQSVKPNKELCKPSWNSPEIVKAEEYNELLRSSKFVPCMRGISALESYRLYEALEHGAIPFYLPSESSKCTDEYAELFGKHPFLGFPSWAEAAAYLPKLAEQSEIMEKHRQQLQAWWATAKQDIRVKLKALF